MKDELKKLFFRFLPLFVIAVIIAFYLEQVKLLLYKLSLVALGWSFAELIWRLYAYTLRIHLEYETGTTLIAWALFRGLIYASVIFSVSNAL